MQITMLESKGVIGETDMLQTMQQDALRVAEKALDVFDVTDSIDIASFIKKEFDKVYGPGWQCIVGTNFGSFVTHCHGCFIHYCIGNLAILLFRGLGGPEVAQADWFSGGLETLKA
ncbi:Dynein light chain [Macleaya cordata]|uniref:Dynein light chain n=1 Tax=Macleaya cordata TaxID=56857 RepID=A0A200QBX8_MACCD|nr:Dynein light chain [Macleaya cordata]